MSFKILINKKPDIGYAFCGSGAGILLIAGFFLFGSPDFFARTETPQFCGLCHAMKNQRETWFHSGHKGVLCIDCHLPNDNPANHYLWKSIDGAKDLIYHFSGIKEADEITLSGHGRKVLLANCIRCHTDMVEHINTMRNCWDCHRTLSHRRTGVIDIRQ
ncbi:MAG: NapC/NirT family cytochrome c [Elusimicrobia bacterium]|nr:NapC/NirT family cytochrome c [Elusimicrobiota bacterium]